MGGREKGQLVIVHDNKRKIKIKGRKIIEREGEKEEEKKGERNWEKVVFT